MNSPRKYIGWHILGCLLFLTIPVLLWPHPDNINIWIQPPTVRDLIANALMLVVFYVNYFLWIPRFYFHQRYTLYGIVLVTAFAVICLIPSLISGYVPWSGPMPIPPDGMMPDAKPFRNDNFLMMINHQILLFPSVVLLSVVLRIRDRLLETERSQYEAELTSLKGQINPHFLFNTLNSVYALAVREKADTTSSAILKLSGLMRYVVTEAQEQFVPLEKEVAYLKDYIALQQIRLDKRILLSFTIEGEPSGQRMAPLLMVPFVENAFKHGANPDADSAIDIRLQIFQEQITLTVTNNKVSMQLSGHETSGRGIANTRSRLQLLYPGNHALSIVDDAQQFRVELSVLL